MGFFFVPILVCEKLIIVEEKGNIRKRKKEQRKIKKEG